MKQKSKNSNNLVTKSFFQNELKNELKKYATKKDLREQLVSLEIRVRRMIDELKLDITEANREYRDEFRRNIDPILKEVLASREARTITAHQISELDKRVAKFEIANAA